MGAGAMLAPCALSKTYDQFLACLKRLSVRGVHRKGRLTVARPCGKMSGGALAEVLVKSARSPPATVSPAAWRIFARSSRRPSPRLAGVPWGSPPAVLPHSSRELPELRSTATLTLWCMPCWVLPFCRRHPRGPLQVPGAAVTGVSRAPMEEGWGVVDRENPDGRVGTRAASA